MQPSSRWQRLNWQILRPMIMVWLFLSSLGIAWIFSTVKEDLQAQLLERARTVAQTTQYAAESASNLAGVQRFVAALAADPSINHIIIVAGNPPEIIAANELALLGKQLAQLNHSTFKEDLNLILKKRAPYYEFNQNYHEFEYGEPLLLNNLQLKNQPLNYGAMIIHFRTERIEFALSKMLLFLFSIFVLLMLLLGATVLWLIRQSILSPVTNILSTVAKRQQGELALVHITGSNELSLLGMAINQMLLMNDEQAARLQLASRALKMGVWSWTPASSLRVWDAALYELYGATRQGTPEEIRQLRMRPDDIARENALCSQTSAPSFSYIFGIDLNGKTRYLMSAGQISGQQWLGLCLDVTELKEAQLHAEEANRAKSAFLANMSHEIRTPMNAVLGFAQLLQQANLKPNEQEYLNHIQTAGDALLTLINDILDFSKIESGKLEIESVSFNLPWVLHSAIDMVSVRAKEKNIPVRIVTNAGSQTQFWGDPGRLRQILINLLHNAIKFTQQGEINITLHTGPADQGGCNIRLQISDTGMGMSEAELARLFQPFSQADISTTRRFGGTGLGLSISKRLLEAMGGHFTVQSQQGQGSCFTMELWLKTAPETAQLQYAALTGKRVLLIYEAQNPDAVLLDRLSELPCKITPLALSHWPPQEPYDLWLFHPAPDCNLLALQTLKQAHMQTPSVLLSSASMGSEREASGFDACLNIPFTTGQLALCLSATLGKTGRHILARPPVREARTPQILLVDDNAVNLKVAELILQQLGCHVETAPNGLQAVERVLEEDFDLVLMDCQMPVMDGYT
ncbi:MAG: ATP-binding protein, partial [Iodobacter sp.]